MGRRPAAGRTMIWKIATVRSFECIALWLCEGKPAVGSRPDAFPVQWMGSHRCPLRLARVLLTPLPAYPDPRGPPARCRPTRPSRFTSATYHSRPMPR